MKVALWLTTVWALAITAWHAFLWKTYTWEREACAGWKKAAENEYRRLTNAWGETDKAERRAKENADAAKKWRLYEQYHRENLATLREMGGATPEAHKVLVGRLVRSLKRTHDLSEADPAPVAAPATVPVGTPGGGLHFVAPPVVPFVVVDQLRGGRRTRVIRRR